MILFYDFETTGLPNYGLPSEHPTQPHLVEVGAVLVDDQWNEVHTLSVIVKPEGWTIPQEAAAIHGITTERAQEVGAPEGEVVGALWGMVEQARMRVAFNDAFDSRLFRIALKRFGTEEQAERWKAFPVSCAMRMATPICKLPPTPKMLAKNMRFNKNPNLTEACRIIMGHDHTGAAHSALGDVQATVMLYRKMMQGKASASQAPAVTSFNG